MNRFYAISFLVLMVLVAAVGGEPDWRSNKNGVWDAINDGTLKPLD